MDRAGSFNVMSLFSRGASPPPTTGQDTNSPPPQPSSSNQYQQQAQQNPPASQSYRENQPSSSPPTKVLDSLFRNIGPQPSQSSEAPAQVGGNNPFRPQQPPQNNSAPTTPVSSTTAASGQSNAPNIQPADRQSALLSLLGSVASPAGSVSSNSANQPSTNQPSQVPQQPPTPPISDQRARAMPGANEAQGKILLEQLMSGMFEAPMSYTVNSSNAGTGFNDSPAQNAYNGPLPGSYQGRIYGPMLPGSDPYQGSYMSQDTPRENVPQPVSAPQPPSQSMFDYITPFDVLAAPASGKKKADVGYTSTESRETEDSWTSASTSVDPKRKSVENLMDQLARSQGPPQATQQSLDPYGAEPSTPPAEVAQLPSKVSLSHPSNALQGQGSPRASPPYSQRSQQGRSGDSPLLQSGALKPNQASAGPSSKERAGSPLAKGSWKAQESKQRAPIPRRPLVSPSTPSQNIVFDVSQNLDSIQASRDCVRSTAIALVKVESTFLPGTTIGATHWVAYAMTRGRVRVISRSSGDRTLLQLPSSFGNTVSVTDMAVHGNRLAGVTSDGGFVVWELPELITDDVPGRLLVYVVPSSDADPLHAVKWHPRDPDTLAVASESNLYLLNIADCANVYGGEPIGQADLPRVSRVFSIPTPLASFDFDLAHHAIATITEDSVLTVWSTLDKYPLWQSKIPGDGAPSSLNFVDAGVVIGRKSGTSFQLLPALSDVVLSTIKFNNAGRDDPDMFGHITYDSRIQTLWVANSRRDSLVAFRIAFDMIAPISGEEEVLRGAYIDQVVEFVGPKPTIHFVILTADADPTGDEANAACIAAKLPPGDLALVAFSVHSSGVDQVLIKKEWYDSAFASATTKYPPYTPPQLNTQAPRQPTIAAAPQTLSQPIPSVPVRLRTPPSEEVEIEHAKEDSRDVKGKGAKGKNVGWKDRDESNKDKGKGPAGESSSPLTDSTLGVSLQKEIRKVEENLHTRIGRLIAKEMDKQHQRLEEARANEQTAEFVRQEKILKLISNELTKNTTRVVEMAVKGEVQNSVLPSLENITKVEVKSAMNNQIAKGLSDSMKITLPPEIEKMLLKPELSNQIARTLSNNLSPFIERYVKEAVSKTLVPAFQAQTTVMHQELAREMQNEIMGLKKDVISWQTEALRSQETMIRDMEQSIRTLSEQIKFLTLNTATLQQSSSSTAMTTRNSPGPVTSSYGPSPMSYRGAGMPSMGNQHGNFSTSFQPPPPPLHGQWHQSIPNTHATPPAVAGPQPQQAVQQTPPRQDEWDDTYLAVLGSQDLKQLRELLARSNPEVIMPTNGPGPLSQAVILTLVHRLAGAIGETSPVDEAFKSSLWWLQRAATTLNTNDPLISPYTARVLPNVQQMLNTTKQRLGLLPGGPQLIDTTRMISDIQDTLSRKPM